MGMDSFWRNWKLTLGQIWQCLQYQVEANPLKTVAVLGGILVLWFFLRPRFRKG